MIKRGAKVDYHAMETMVHDMYDGETPVILIEVFGPPEEMSYDSREDCERGPWYAGEKEEVLTFALECGYPYDIQYEIDHTEETHGA